MHDLVAEKAVASTHQREIHINFNKLINKTVGMGSGERDGLPLPRRALLVVAQDVAARALRTAKDHHDGYQNAKRLLGALGQALIETRAAR